MKKIISILLAVTMLASITACFTTTASATETRTIRPGESQTVTIPDKDVVNFNFTPSVTSKYYFYYTNPEIDFYCEVRLNGEAIYGCDDNFSDEGYNFITNNLTLVAGKTYTFQVGSYESTSKSATFTLTRVKPDSSDNLVMLSAIKFNVPVPSVGDKNNEDFTISTTTWPAGYGFSNIKQYWVTDDSTFSEGRYKFDGDSWIDYDRADYDENTLVYVNDRFIGTMGELEWEPYVIVCNHDYYTYRPYPASCTFDGCTSAFVCVGCNRLILKPGDTIAKAATIKKSATSFKFNGNVQRPTITVFDRNGKQLTYKKDFTVDYSNWSSCLPGTYYVTVRLIGDYEDVRTYPYTITGTVNAKDFQMKLNRNAITTTNTVQRPAVTVSYKGTALTYNKDFTVEFSNWNSTYVGRYTVTAVGLGKYEGMTFGTMPYYINPKGTTFLTSAQGGFKGVKNGFTLKWNKQSDQTTGYQIQYSTRSDFANAATYTVNGANTTSATITGRAAKTRYYVRIRTFTKNSQGTFYSDWSAGTKSVVTL